MAHGA
jgi:hypothetical protein